jgi:hypothetical protein
VTFTLFPLPTIYYPPKLKIVYLKSTPIRMRLSTICLCLKYRAVVVLPIFRYITRIDSNFNVTTIYLVHFTASAINQVGYCEDHPNSLTPEEMRMFSRLDVDSSCITWERGSFRSLWDVNIYHLFMAFSCSFGRKSERTGTTSENPGFRVLARNIPPKPLTYVLSFQAPGKKNTSDQTERRGKPADVQEITGQCRLQASA